MKLPMPIVSGDIQTYHVASSRAVPQQQQSTEHSLTPRGLGVDSQRLEEQAKVSEIPVNEAPEKEAKVEIEEVLSATVRGSRRGDSDFKIRANQSDIESLRDLVRATQAPVQQSEKHLTARDQLSQTDLMGSSIHEGLVLSQNASSLKAGSARPPRVIKAKIQRYGSTATANCKGYEVSMSQYSESSGLPVQEFQASSSTAARPINRARTYMTQRTQLVSDKMQSLGAEESKQSSLHDMREEMEQPDQSSQQSDVLPSTPQASNHASWAHQKQSDIVVSYQDNQSQSAVRPEIDPEIRSSDHMFDRMSATQAPDFPVPKRATTQLQLVVQQQPQLDNLSNQNLASFGPEASYKSSLGSSVAGPASDFDRPIIGQKSLEKERIATQETFKSIDQSKPFEAESRVSDFAPEPLLDRPVLAQKSVQQERLVTQETFKSVDQSKPFEADSRVSDFAAEPLWDRAILAQKSVEQERLVTQETFKSVNQSKPFEAESRMSDFAPNQLQDRPIPAQKSVQQERLVTQETFKSVDQSKPFDAESRVSDFAPEPLWDRPILAQKSVEQERLVTQETFKSVDQSKPFDAESRVSDFAPEPQQDRPILAQKSVEQERLVTQETFKSVDQSKPFDAESRVSDFAPEPLLDRPVLAQKSVQQERLVTQETFKSVDQSKPFEADSRVSDFAAEPQSPLSAPSVKQQLLTAETQRDKVLKASLCHDSNASSLHLEDGQAQQESSVKAQSKEELSTQRSQKVKSLLKAECDDSITSLHDPVAIQQVKDPTPPTKKERPDTHRSLKITPPFNKNFDDDISSLADGQYPLVQHQAINKPSQIPDLILYHKVEVSTHRSQRVRGDLQTDSHASSLREELPEVAPQVTQIEPLHTSQVEQELDTARSKLIVQALRQSSFESAIRVPQEPDPVPTVTKVELFEQPLLTQREKCAPYLESQETVKENDEIVQPPILQNLMSTPQEEGRLSPVKPCPSEQSFALAQSDLQSEPSQNDPSQNEPASESFDRPVLPQQDPALNAKTEETPRGIVQKTPIMQLSEQSLPDFLPMVVPKPKEPTPRVKRAPSLTNSANLSNSFRDEASSDQEIPPDVCAAFEKSVQLSEQPSESVRRMYVVKPQKSPTMRLQSAEKRIQQQDQPSDKSSFINPLPVSEPSLEEPAKAQAPSFHSVETAEPPLLSVLSETADNFSLKTEQAATSEPKVPLIKIKPSQIKGVKRANKKASSRSSQALAATRQVIGSRHIKSSQPGSEFTELLQNSASRGAAIETSNKDQSQADLTTAREISVDRGIKYLYLGQGAANQTTSNNKSVSQGIITQQPEATQPVPVLAKADDKKLNKSQVSSAVDKRSRMYDTGVVEASFSGQFWAQQSEQSEEGKQSLEVSPHKSDMGEQPESEQAEEEALLTHFSHSGLTGQLHFLAIPESLMPSCILDDTRPGIQVKFEVTTVNTSLVQLLRDSEAIDTKNIAINLDKVSKNYEVVNFQDFCQQYLINRCVFVVDTPDTDPFLALSLQNEMLQVLASKLTIPLSRPTSGVTTGGRVTSGRDEARVYSQEPSQYDEHSSNGHYQDRSPQQRQSGGLPSPWNNKKAGRANASLSAIEDVTDDQNIQATSEGATTLAAQVSAQIPQFSMPLERYPTHQDRAKETSLHGGTGADVLFAASKNDINNKSEMDDKKQKPQSNNSNMMLQ